MRVATDTGSMVVPLRDHGPRSILTFGRLQHETHETELLTRIAQRISSAIDIGANVGWYTRILGGGGVEVSALEPSPTTCRFLRQNTSDLPTASVHQIAIGDHDGTTTFYAAESSDLSSTTRQIGEPETVRASTLDSFVGKFGKIPDLVKCDVEGGEVAVLRGARRLAQANAPIWLLEANERFLREQGLDYESLDLEFEHTSPNARMYVFGESGKWQRIEGFTELRNIKRANVLVVPTQRAHVVEDLVESPT